MECKFHVGQKVVCVREHDLSIRIEMALFGMFAPVEGEIYTIRAVREVGGDLVVFLDEITNPIRSFACGCVDELGFCPSRFRPIIDRKTDISIFKAMLTPKHEQVPA